jgi:hypothetical protein
MSLSKLPYEIIGLIVQELELDDVFHLSLSPRFGYLIKEDRVCKAILEVLSKEPKPFPIPGLSEGYEVLAWARHQGQHTGHACLEENLS